MNEMLKTILNHRSVRSFSEKPVDGQAVQEIIEAGRHGATSAGQQAFSIIQVTDKAIRSEIAQITGQPYSAEAPLWFLIVLDLHRNAEIVHEQGAYFTGDGDFYTFIQSCMDGAIAAQNMALAAESMGLGICYFGSIFMNIKRIAELVQLPPLTFPLTGLGMGYPKGAFMKKPRLPENVQVFTNQYKVFPDYLDILKEYDSIMHEYIDSRHPEGPVPPFTVQVMHRNTGPAVQGEEALSLLKKQGFSWAGNE